MHWNCKWISCKKISLAFDENRLKRRHQPESNFQRITTFFMRKSNWISESTHEHKLAFRNMNLCVSRKEKKNTKNVCVCVSSFCGSTHKIYIISHFHVLHFNISLASNFTAIYAWQFYLVWMAFLQVFRVYFRLRFVDVVSVLYLGNRDREREREVGGKKRPNSNSTNSNNVMFGKLRVCVCIGAWILLFSLCFV